MSRSIKLPTLYKKTNTGAIQQWAIRVDATLITVEHGQVGGKLQKTSDTIRTGKNSGRKNETGPEEQAEKEATSQWIKKKKSGYVETLLEAIDGVTDELIEGGSLPMLAKVYEDHMEDIKFPVAVQPKLDGHRCIAVITEDCKVSLWTRTRKRITSVPHIEKSLTNAAKKLCLGGSILDGELYSHKMRDNFEKITSIVRKKDATVDSAQIQYHVYDRQGFLGFEDRISTLKGLSNLGGSSLVLVDTKLAKSAEEVGKYFTEYKQAGYEGAMVRLLGIGYEGKRSKQLLKVKSFEDAEFQIVGVEEGRGKLQGHAGAFICRDLTSGKDFNAKMSGETEKLKEYWVNKKFYIGGMLTVKFQGRTSDGIPRFPVGIRLWSPL